MSTPRFDPERLTRLLVKHGVRFVLIGGVAATLHGSPLLTADLDIAYQRTKANVRRLASALAEAHARLRGVEGDLPFKPDARTLEAGSNFTFVTDLGNLDCLGWVEGVTAFDALSGRAVAMKLSGDEILVASIDDLIAMKRAAGRPKDRLAIAHLEAVREMQAE